MEKDEKLKFVQITGDEVLYGLDKNGQVWELVFPNEFPLTGRYKWIKLSMLTKLQE